ncbi:MAG: HEAT repeat domain-containing protein [Polyangiaceae bacterium]
MSDVDKIIRLLDSDAIEKKIAAAIVLGEIGARGAAVVEGLTKALASEVPLLQRHALDALARTGAARTLPAIAPLLAARDEEVRHAAVAAMVSVGQTVLPILQQRRATATPEEKRSMDAILAALGGTDAFHVLLEGLLSSNAETAKAAAIAVRQRVREADAKQRRSYLVETEKFLRKADKIATESRGGYVAVAAAIKILGYLEDERAVPTLLEFAKAKRNEPAVRQEALIALRFVLAPKDGDGGRAKSQASASDAVAALVAAAEDPDRSLAQTALHTLASLRLPASVARRLEKLTGHPDLERARLAIEMVGRQAGEAHAAVLVNVIATTPDKRRAETDSQCLVEALEGEAARTPGADPVRKDAVAPLAKALVDASDADRAWLLRTVLRPSAKDVPASLRKQILATAAARLEGGVRGWEPLLAAARDADSRGTADALRAQAARLKKSGAERAVRVLRALCQSDSCTDDDRYDWAVAELARGARDTRPGAREADESLRLLSSLLARGVDVGARLRKDRGVDLEHLYYVGFHFAESGAPLGTELLQAVADRGGRAKIAKMARSKLSLGG